MQGRKWDLPVGTGAALSGDLGMRRGIKDWGLVCSSPKGSSFQQRELESALCSNAQISLESQGEKNQRSPDGFPEMLCLSFHSHCLRISQWLSQPWPRQEQAGRSVFPSLEVLALGWSCSFLHQNREAINPAVGDY